MLDPSQDSMHPLYMASSACTHEGVSFRALGMEVGDQCRGRPCADYETSEKGIETRRHCCGVLESGGVFQSEVDLYARPLSCNLFAMRLFPEATNTSCHEGAFTAFPTLKQMLFVLVWKVDRLNVF